MWLKKKMIFKNVEKSYYFTIFIISFIIHCIPNFYIRTITSLPTEFASLGGASSLVGYSWSTVISSLPYYGNGLYIILFPLMKVITNPYIFHQITLLFTTFFAVFPSMICYKLLREKFKLDNKNYCAIVSLIVSFFDVVTSSIAINEHGLKLILWIVIYLLIDNVNAEREKMRKNTLYITIILSYSLLIHTRSILLIILVFLCVIFIKLYYKSDIVNLIEFIFLMIVGLLFANHLKDILVNNVWKEVDANTMLNSTGTIINSFDSIKTVFTKYGFLGYLNTVIGQLFSASIYSMGIFMVMIIDFCFYIKLIILKKELIDIKETIIFFITFFGVVATIFGMGLLSVHGTAIAVENNYGAKAYFYLRYFFFYLSPFLVNISVMFSNKNRDYVYIRKLYFLIFSCLFLYVAIFIIPTAANQLSTKLDYFHYFSSLSFRRYGESIKAIDIIMATFVVLVYSVIVFWILNKNKKVVLLIVLISNIYQYSYLSLFYNRNKSIENLQLVDGLNIFISNNLVNNKIYVSNYYAKQVAQFENPETTIYSYNGEQLEKGSLVHSNKIIGDKDLEKQHLELLSQLDENEFLYVGM